MRTIIHFFIRLFFAVFASAVTLLISMILSDGPSFMPYLLAFAAGIVTYYGVKLFMYIRFLRRNGLTRREYKIVERNLDEAKNKIYRLQKTFMKIQNLPHAKQNFETMRVIHKIYHTTKKEPRRFFLVEDFYYSHLDSLVELAEKYTFLASQPAKSLELKRSLAETRETMNDVVKMIEKDLHHMIEGDIDSLLFEMDVAKKRIDRS